MEASIQLEKERQREADALRSLALFSSGKASVSVSIRVQGVSVGQEFPRLRLRVWTREAALLRKGLTVFSFRRAFSGE